MLLAKLLRHQTDFGEVLRLVARKSAQLLHANTAIVSMINPDTRETIKTIIREGRSSRQKEFRKITINVSGWIVNHNKPLFTTDIHRDDRFPGVSFDDLSVKSVLGVPLIIEGMTIGVLILLYEEPPESNDAALTESLESVASISAPFLRNVQKVKSYFETNLPDSTLLTKYNHAGLLGKSPNFVDLLHAVEAAAKCDVRVLLDGKTGTGKELIAKAIHRYSARSEGPFVAVDCGAIPANLIESELFGHKRGAFTGASTDRAGLFAEADKGTLFMDEINNLPFDMQSKLLRVLQEGEFRTVGSDQVKCVNIRIIAASSIPLKSLVDEKFFREDLFFRLHVYPIDIPDLQERQEDIPILAKHFLLRFAQQQGKTASCFHEEIIEFMRQHQWKGNIRELENFIERLVTVVPPEVSMIDPDCLPPDIRKDHNKYRSEVQTENTGISLKHRLEDFEAEIIRNTLNECDWNQSKAARLLKLSESNIRFKINQLGIQRQDCD